MGLLTPLKLNVGDTIGVFTPSLPGYAYNLDLFENGLSNLRKMGFQIKLGGLTEARRSQGYRPASGHERAQEMMELINDPSVHALIATYGGATSNSLIPHLDFQRIREARKLICGFSDISSLHLSIAHYSRLQTLYGPTIMGGLGEWPGLDPVSKDYFLQAVQSHTSGERPFQKPRVWSQQAPGWQNDDWKTVPRKWETNSGWNVIREGLATGPIVPVCFNIFISACGTEYFPDLTDKILLLEDTEATLSRTERNLSQLRLMGVFDKIVGLIISKPEYFDAQGAPFGYDDLFREIIGERPYPIVSGFDCGHTLPMLCIPVHASGMLLAEKGEAEFTLLDGSIDAGSV